MQFPFSDVGIFFVGFLQLFLHYWNPTFGLIAFIYERMETINGKLAEIVRETTTKEHSTPLKTKSTLALLIATCELEGQQQQHHKPHYL